MSSSSAAFSLDQISPPASEKLCYVHCNFCDTVLAVSVPFTSLFKTVTVRCGHCTNLLSVNMRGIFLPVRSNIMEEDVVSFPPQNLVMDNQFGLSNNAIIPALGKVAEEEIPQKPVINRPPEKRQRVPSAYNRFIKDEIQRIKAGNPDITHREAFSAAAKNWAHFPHIHFGLMPDQAMKKTSVHPPEGEDFLLKDGFFAANMEVAPFFGL